MRCQSWFSTTEWPKIKKNSSEKINLIIKISLLCHRECTDILIHCYWNKKEFPCCQHFHWLYTTNGSCLSFNSDQIPGSTRFTGDSQSEPASLIIILETKVHVFIHDSKEVNMNNIDNDFTKKQDKMIVQNGNSMMVLIKSIGAIIADDSMSNLDLTRRGCILPGELDDTMLYYPIYSRSACLLECQFNRQMYKCNCSQHNLYRDAQNGEKELKKSSSNNCEFKNKDNYCRNTNQLQCIQNIRNTENNDTECFCPPTCEENEYRIVWYHMTRFQKRRVKLKIQLISSPKERIIMRPRFDRLHIFVGLVCFSRIFTSKHIFNIGCSLIKILKNKRKLSQVNSPDLICEQDNNNYLI